MTETEWMLRGKCYVQGREAREFVPSFDTEKENSIRLTAEAKRICNGTPVCPVRTECLEYALVNRINLGVWGGASEFQRRKILRARDRQSTQLFINGSDNPETS